MVLDRLYHPKTFPQMFAVEKLYLIFICYFGLWEVQPHLRKSLSN